MAVVAAGYRKGLVSAGWPVLLFSCTNKCRKRSFHLIGGFLGSFQSGGAFSGQRALTIEYSVMSGVMNQQKTSEGRCGSSFLG